MNFYYQYNDSRYDPDAIIEPVSSTDLFHKLQTDINNTRSCKHLTGIVSTEIKHWRSIKHILFLDCDTFYHMTGATRILNLHNINYEIILSSKCFDDDFTRNKFWIVCDIIDEFSEVAKIMSWIPGVDVKYQSYSNAHKKFFVRATPNYRTIKHKEKSTFELLPVFPETINSKLSRPVRKWITEFRSHFECESMRRLIEHKKIIDSYRDGTLTQDIHKSTFVF